MPGLAGDTCKPDVLNSCEKFMQCKPMNYDKKSTTCQCLDGYAVDSDRFCSTFLNE